MREKQIDIVRIFNQAWSELYCPPVRLSITEEDRDQKNPKFIVTNGTICLSSNIIPKGVDSEEYLLWYFRHQLAHIHHCPYDIRTAYSLERAAFEVTYDWDLAYLAMQIFSDVQVDLHYLPSRFGEIPYHVRIVGRRSSELLSEKIMEAVYLCVNPAFKIRDKSLSEAAREIIFISYLERPWHVKVQMIASVLSRLMKRNPRIFSRKKIERSIMSKPVYVREDFANSTIDRFMETYGSVKDESEARRFYEQWIKPRLSEDEKKKINESLRKRFGRERDLRKLMSKIRGEAGYKATNSKSCPSPSEDLRDEPHLSVTLSKPYDKIMEKIDEVLWRRYWFKSRAQQAIIEYLTESRRRRPVWSIIRYPDEWYIEDEIEELDIETSLDEGPLIPEVTTLKWIKEPAPHGQSFSSGFVPSAIIILDASLSMRRVHNEAAIAGFIAHLSARRAGGDTAIITFSTGFVSARWEDPEEFKELTLSMRFDEFTIFPIHEVKALLSEKSEPCFIIIITDGGWQNLDEAIPFLEEEARMEHKITVFLIKGGEYSDRVKHIERVPHLRIWNVVKPEKDLHKLVLSETMRTYKQFIT